MTEPFTHGRLAPGDEVHILPDPDMDDEFSPTEGTVVELIGNELYLVEVEGCPGCEVGEYCEILGEFLERKE
jgi:hypothetical protein